MNRAALIINASAGKKRDLRTLVPALLQVLARKGIEANAAVTTTSRESRTLAAEAAASGCQAIFACGGDGTVHEILQGLVGTTAALGVVPLGTANVLARNLRLSLDPLKALQQQLSFEPRAVSVAEAHYAIKAGEAIEADKATRYFIVLAGAGPDGALVYRMLSGKRSRFGRNIYYVHALRLFLTRRFPAFRVEYRRSGSDNWEEQLGVSVICSRVADLGGVFSRLTRGGSLLDKDLHLVVIKPPAGITLPAWFALSRVGLNTSNPWLEAVRVSEFRCTPLRPNHRIHTEVDGEWIGHLPISVRLLPEAVSLLMPKGSEPAER